MSQLPALDQAQQAVAALVKRFANNLDAYSRGEYKETEVRHEYIDPFFEALGWDVHNRAGHDEQYKDVIHEESVRVGAGIKAPDYTFRLGRERKFFVEAKKPSVNVKEDAGPAYQLRRYAWSAHLPLSILTDFQEFAVYDCTQRPTPSDKASLGRVAYYTFEQYPARLPEIWETFAKENVWRGSFDRYASSARGKRGTSEVDDVFLREIEGWRDALAHNLALRNPQLSVPDLNYAVQVTIDRIVFLRVAEDRGIEEYGHLQQLVNGANAYPRLTELYRQADQKYNSGLFDFVADTLSMKLELDDKPLQSILSGLYFPQSPYEFSVIGAEILGQVYEQFLGKVIRLTPGHRAVVEEKPEVKKAGGVYYTPRYIVDYIVEHTVGELVKGKSPAEIAGGRFPVASNQLSAGKRTARAAGARKLVTGNRQLETGNPPLRILDPACGSGSFLLGAYRYLLEHCLNWYSAHDPERWAAARQPPLRRGAHGEWLLTTAEKKRILLAHIYGVDIDRQAVEVTKLSLLLKVLEGESQETLGRQLSYWQERALPDLVRNIQCGNSLIGPDYWQDRLMLDEEEMRRVNPLDWQAAFPEAMAAGGFDAVIGNPPYGANLSPDEVNYLQRHLADSKALDTYELFLLRGSKLLKKMGGLSMIIPASWLTGEKYLSSRTALLTSLKPAAALAMPFDVFKGAYIDTAIVVLRTDSKTDSCLVHVFPKKEKLSKIPDDVGVSVPLDRIRHDPLVRLSVLLAARSAPIMTKLGRGPLTFGLCFDIQRGVQPYSRKKHTEDQISRRFLHATFQKGSDYLPELQGSELSRYWVQPQRVSYLRYCEEIASIRAPRMFEGERIVLRRLLTRKFRLQASIATERMITTDNVLNMVPKSGDVSVPFAVGILNSRLISWVYVNTSMVAQKDDFPQVHLSALAALPLPSADVTRHDHMVALVECMLELHQRQAAAQTPADRELYARQIAATDREIDALVYELYGLTEEEIAVVEGVRAQGGQVDGRD